MARTDKGKRRARDSEEESNEELGTDYSEEETSISRRKSTASKKKQAKNKKAVASDDSEASEQEGAATQQAKKGKTKPLTDDEKKRLAYELARHAIVCELTNHPIRREDCVNTFMSGAPRQFETILGYASGYLARNFGLEIVPLRPKLEAGNQKTTAWAVRSKLPASVLRAASLEQFNALRSDVEVEEGSEKSLHGQVAAYRADGEYPGSLRDWRYEDGANYAVVGVILAIILVNGKALLDDQLVSHMKKLRIFPASKISPSMATFTNAPPTFRQFLQTLIKQGYLEVSKVAGAGGAAAQGAQTQRGGNKGRAGRLSLGTQRAGGANADNSNDAGDPSLEWRWGARAETELGEEGVAKFIEAVFAATATGTASDNEDDNDDESQEEEEDVDMGGDDERKKKKKSGQPTAAELRHAITRSADVKTLGNAADVKACG